MSKDIEDAARDDVLHDLGIRILDREMKKMLAMMIIIIDKHRANMSRISLVTLL